VNYWLENSMQIGYQNQSTVWYLGGDNITFEGFGRGTFDGNGQTWYEFVNGVSNYPSK
jgi:galacturan 1,4-alpha-galacturonidase